MKTAFLTIALILGVCALAATNEVAQCWAVTKSGSRCKRRAAPQARYCRQHTADREQKDTPTQCGSMATNCVRCAERPAPSRSYCPQHLK